MAATGLFGRKVVGRLTVAVLVLLGAAALGLFAGVKTGLVQTYIVTSGSMEPAIDTGALLLSRSVPAPAIGVGDVVTVAASSGAMVTHRVEEVHGVAGEPWRALVLRGDANAAVDPAPYVVTEADVPVAVVPGLGTGLLWVQDGMRLVWLGVAGAAAVLLVAVGRGYRVMSARDLVASAAEGDDVRTDRVEVVR